MTSKTNLPRVTFTTGAPGAGKTYTVEKLYPGRTIVDSDRIKSAHPDYDPKNPGALHAWSSKEATKAFYSMLGGNESFVFDGTGTDVAKLTRMMNSAVEAGFETELLVVKVSLATAMERNSKRERVVPESIVREKFALLSTTVDLLSNSVDRVTVVNND